jgi:hypothetical protein
MPTKHKGGHMDILELLKPALELGCSFEWSHDNGVIVIDLNTGAKSGCKLKIDGDAVMAYRRYDRIDAVTSFDDVLRLVHECAHGRSYFDEGWLRVFDFYAMDDPRGPL